MTTVEQRLAVTKLDRDLNTGRISDAEHAIEVARVLSARKLQDLEHAIRAAPMGGEMKLLAWKRHVLEVAQPLFPVAPDEAQEVSDG